jgi:hypothetical protein
MRMEDNRTVTRARGGQVPKNLGQDLQDFHDYKFILSIL